MQPKPKLRASRVIALCRIALALAVLGTSVLDPAYPFHRTGSGELVLGAYTLFGIAMLAIAWRNWWLNHHLRLIGFIIDTLAAFATLYWIEATGQGFISPFMAFFTYLMLTGTLNWRARGAVIVAIALVALYVGVGVAMNASGIEWHSGWFGRRLVFMSVIASFIIWYGLQRAHEQPDRLAWPVDAGIDAQFAAIAGFVARHITCTGLAIAWAPDEEPWTCVHANGVFGDRTMHLGPEEFSLPESDGGKAMLFDRGRNRGLRLGDNGVIAAIRGPLDNPLAALLSVNSGIVMPLQSRMGRGAILLTGIPGVSGDHLPAIRALAIEIGYALDRHEMAAITRAAEAARIRDAVARDLHDGIVQSLSGACFRIAALRSAMEAGKDIGEDLAALQRSLEREEVIVERLIARLREGDAATGTRDVSAELGLSLRDSIDRWGISGSFETDGKIDLLSPVLVHDIEQLVREAVANAVKHGKAEHVDVILGQDGQTLHLAIIDHGSGFDVGGDGGGQLPRSIAERVRSLGGSLEISSRSGYTRLSISLPAGGRH